MSMQIGQEIGTRIIQKSQEEPKNAYSRTDCVVTYADCLIIWFSKMQTLIALSTTEAKLIVLHSSTQIHSFHELIEGTD